METKMGILETKLGILETQRWIYCIIIIAILSIFGSHILWDINKVLRIIIEIPLMLILPWVITLFGNNITKTRELRKQIPGG